MTLAKPLLTYYIINLSVSSLLIVGYLCTLYRVLRGVRFTFLIILVVELAISCMGSIVNVAFNWREATNQDCDMVPTPDQKCINYLYAQGFASCIRDSTFNTAHWLFAYKYWLIAYTMPKLLKGQ